LWAFLIPLKAYRWPNRLAAADSSNSSNKEILIQARRYSYSPNIIEVNKGDRVVLRLISEDVHHGIYLDGYGLQTSARPGQEGTISFQATRTGRFPFRCTITCGALHPYMIGYLEVVPNENFFLFGLGITPLLGLGFILFLINGFMEHKILGVFPLSWKLDLSKNRLVLKLLKSRWMPFSLIIINLAVFTVILLAGWLGGKRPGNYNFGIMIVWIVWWVLLMLVLVPFFGRLWCAICPLPFFGDWLQRLRLIKVRNNRLWGLNKRWPKKLRNMWLVNFIFLITTFFTAFFTTRPIYTFVLLGLIIALNIVVSFIYERRSFCRYLCPVAGFQGLYANIAPIEIRPKDQEVCRKHKRKECYLGNEDGYGCPWLEVPYSMKKNTYCGLCLECFKTCSYNNMALNIRTPGVDLLVDDKRGMDEAWKSFIMIGCAISFYTIMQGPWGWLRDWANFTTTSGYLSYIFLHSFNSLILIPALFGLFVWLSKHFAQGSNAPFSRIFVNLSYSLVPMGLAVWVAFSFGIFFPNSSYLLRVLSDPYNWNWNLLGTRDFPWTPFLTGILPYVQIFILSLGLIVSLDIGYRLSQQTFSRDNGQKGFIPLGFYLVGITIFFLWLFLS
jgi:plastocyanin